VTRPIPEVVPQITPHLVVAGAARAIDFYVAALGCVELYRVLGPDGQRVWFAELLLGESRFFVNDEFPEQNALGPTTLGGTAVALHVFVADVDAAFARAVAAGMTVEIPVADFFWGERYGLLVDPFGHRWGLASRREDLTPAEIQRRAAAYVGRDRS
jgi:PhnB protein